MPCRTYDPVLSERFQEALDDLTRTIQAAGTRPPFDLLEQLRWFAWLHQLGEKAHPEAIAAYLVEVGGWQAPPAARAGHTWDVIIGLRNYDRIVKAGRRRGR